MKSTKRIIWETKREMYNRLHGAMEDTIRSMESIGVDKETAAFSGGLAMMRELGEIRDELEKEAKGE